MLAQRTSCLILLLLASNGCSQPSAGPPLNPASPGASATEGETPSSAAMEPNAAKNADTSVTERAPNDPAAGAQSGRNAPADTVENLVAKANTALQTQDFDGAVQAAEQALSQAPTNRAALSVMALASQVQGISMVQSGREAEAYPHFMKSAKAMRKLREMSPDLDAQERRFLPVILYNEACVYCRETEPKLEKAVASLKDAIDAGFEDLRQLDLDPDLDPIRELPEFKALRQQLETKKQARQGDENK